MIINDVHIHSRGNETPADVVRDMDDAGVNKAVIFSPYGMLMKYFKEGQARSTDMMTAEQQHESIDFIADMAAEAPDRIIPFAWIEPRLKEAVDEIDRAVNEKRIKGIKMIPHHWYPYDESIFPVYEKIQELGVPILFHSGILWGFEDSSRFCRPTFYEALLHFPKITFALAHISWPWTDECIATAGRFRAAVQREPHRKGNQMLIDTTRGTPDFYRKDAMDKAIKYLGIENLIFGTDSVAGNCRGNYPRHVEEDIKILDELGVSKSDQQKYFASNMDALFKIL